MKILLALTYYRPHVSGLTIYVQRLGEALATRGHQVTVLTSRYAPALPAEEVVAGVRIVRVPVVARVSKGVIMPTFGFVATRLVRQHDVLSLHLPQFDAAGLALRGRLFGRPTVLTYHCDLRLPPGPFNRLVDRVVLLANLAAGTFADRIVAYTKDYADHSPFLRRFRSKIAIIPPPVEVEPCEAEAVAAFRQRYHLAGGPVIGFAARFASEKGVEYVLAALPTVLKRYPHARVLFAGEHENVIGEEDYRRRLRPLLAKYRENWTFLGVLDPHQMAAFYAACDVTVLPSVNSTESFGLVQVESMLCGTPVCASDLPGVRVPVRTTGMGEVVPVRDAGALAAAILRVLANPQAYRRPRTAVEAHFNTGRTCTEYERLFTALLAARASGVSAAGGG